MSIAGRAAIMLAARAEFYDLARSTPAYCRYVREHGLDLTQITAFAGATGILDIVDCGGGRFDWNAKGDTFTAFICEALGRDGETVEDLVAWPTDKPTRTLSLTGVAAWLGAWNVWNPSSYYLGKPLWIHRTPLEWLKARCVGAAIANVGLAGREMLDVPGPIAACDRDHARFLANLLRSASTRTRIVIPRTGRVDS